MPRGQLQLGSWGVERAWDCYIEMLPTLLQLPPFCRSLDTSQLLLLPLHLFTDAPGVYASR